MHAKPFIQTSTGKQYQLMDYSIKNGVAYLFHDMAGQFTCEADAEDIIKRFTPIDKIPEGLLSIKANHTAVTVSPRNGKPEPDHSAPAPLPTTPDTIIKTQATKLADVLMDSISKLQEDKGYIEQAKAINETAGQLINLARTEIMAINTLKGS